MNPMMDVFLAGGLTIIDVGLSKWGGYLTKQPVVDMSSTYSLMMKCFA